METPVEQTGRAHPATDSNDDTHDRPAPRRRRLTPGGWLLGLAAALLAVSGGLLGWTWSSLSAVGGELRRLQAQVAQLESEYRRAGGEAVAGATAQRLHALDQRLSAVESWTQDTSPRLTALEQRPRERVAKPPALPPATQLPRNATNAPQTPQDQQAYRDMRQQAVASGRLGGPVPESFGRWLEWHPAWELRWLSFQVSGQAPLYLYHITYKPDARQRYTMFWDPDRRAWQSWALWQRVP
jgi:hypothetical protein